MILLELWGAGSASFDAHFARPAKPEPVPFLARLALAVGACVVTDLSYSQILFLPIVLYIYLAVDKRLSYVLAVFRVAILLGVKLLDATDIAGPVRLPPMSPAGEAPVGKVLERSLPRFPLGNSTIGT